MEDLQTKERERFSFKRLKEKIPTVVSVFTALGVVSAFRDASNLARLVFLKFDLFFDRIAEFLSVLAFHFPAWAIKEIILFSGIIYFAITGIKRSFIRRDQFSYNKFEYLANFISTYFLAYTLFIKIYAVALDPSLNMKFIEIYFDNIVAFFVAPAIFSIYILFSILFHMYSDQFYGNEKINNDVAEGVGDVVEKDYQMVFMYAIINVMFLLLCATLAVAFDHFKHSELNRKYSVNSFTITIFIFYMFVMMLVSLNPRRARQTAIASTVFLALVYLSIPLNGLFEA